MNKKVLYLAVFWVFHGAALAETPSCENAASQAAINECMSVAYKNADMSLNSTYKQAVLRLKGDAEQHKKLVEAQRAWLKFRDAECAFASGSAGTGSANSMIVSGCMIGLTEQRTKQLHEYLQCPEGDISCPIPN